MVNEMETGRKDRNGNRWT